MITALITSKGQVTIPKIVRDSLHLLAGDKISFILSDEGEAIIRPIAKSATEVFGILSVDSIESVSVEEMDSNLEQAFIDGEL